MTSGSRNRPISDPYVMDYPTTAFLSGVVGPADHGGVEGLLVTVIGGSVVLVVTGVMIYLYQRGWTSPGGARGWVRSGTCSAG
jgi:hypothetical protein